jgi:hypothetical protein
MPGRYDRPAAPPPSVNDLPHLLHEAEPTLRELSEEGIAREARRAVAVRKLLTLARAEVTKTGEPNRLRAMPMELREFLEIAGLRMLLSDDPIAALKHFLGPRKRGRPIEDNKRRDIMIAADVAELAEGGMMTIDASCLQIAHTANLSVEMVREIYYARRCTDEVLLARITVAMLDQAPG